MVSFEELEDLVNSEVRQRTSYGVRYEVAERPGYTLTWSNGAARWFVWYPRVKKGREVMLDANMIFIPGATARDLNYLIEEGLIEPLPLYGGSFERRRMGTPDYSGAELPPAIKLMRDYDLPVEESVEEALERKVRES